jgi:hypothetical protein
MTYGHAKHTMPGLILPRSITIRVSALGGSQSRESRPVAGAVLGVQARGCIKNNYYLGPFFTDAIGVALITRADLARAAEDHLETGQMDYYSLEQCDPIVDIELWTGHAIRRAIRARREIWTQLLPGESARYDSIEDLIRRYEQAPNLTLQSLPPSISDRWADANHEAEYSFVVS